MDSNPNLLTTDEAAAYINKSPDFARRKLKHQIAYFQHKPGGPIQFFKQDLDRWLASHTIQPSR